MSSNFSSLRSSRKNLLNKLAEEVKKDSQKTGGADDRFWKLTVDAKTKIGYAKLRFLPAPKGEEIPWARVWSHAFQGPSGSWFIENCPTTLGNRPCPVCKGNNQLWNSGVDADKEVARKRKRKLQYISNILVLEDPAKPENNGKVFLYKYGAKIHAKVMELIEPEFPDQSPANPFDLWEGCNFKLKSQSVAGYQNYDKSSFEDPSELFDGDDDKKEAVWLQEKPLAEFTAETSFKPFEELESQMQRALSGESHGARTAADAIKHDDAQESEAIQAAAKAVHKEEGVRATRQTKKTVKPEPVEDEVASAEDEDDIKKFFSSLDE